MVYLPLFVMLPLWSTSDGGTLPTSAALNQTNRAARNVSRPPPYLKLPVFVDSGLPLAGKIRSSPGKGARLKSLLEPDRGVLFPVRPKSAPTARTTSGVSVKTSCKPTKMQVQVDRSILGAGEVTHVKLGTCQASKTTTKYLYFEYDMGMCGIKRTIGYYQVAYSTTLRYDPAPIEGPIRRAAPFTLPVTCYYNRYQYSFYKIGYTPRSWRPRIVKPTKNRAQFILTPRNAQWERLFPTDQYILGKPMYFEAEAPSISPDERLYANLCYATPEKSHTSTPQFPVVKNFGCMVESKDSRSRFIPYKTNAVRFSVDAFLFEGMTGQLYMHCSMSVGSSTPTPTAKSCNYDTQAKRWVELYGSDSVCTCCDSNCSSAASTVTKIISSSPWTVEPKAKPIAAPKTKTSTATTTTTTTTKTRVAHPKTTRERCLNPRKTSHPKEVAVTPTGKVENTVKEC